MMKTIRNTFAVFFIFIIFLFTTNGALGLSQSDEIEQSLSLDIVNIVEKRLILPLSESDKAYAYFLLAVYKHDAKARENAEKVYKGIASPESQAFLGSIEMLKARDLERRGFIASLIDLFKKESYIQTGIKKIERAASDHPENLDIRIVRAITFFELPSVFRKFQAGLEDIKTILNWIKEGKITVPKDETLFRDTSSIYYFAGRYFLKINQIPQAKEMFVKSSESSDQSPFSTASRKRLSHLF